MAYADQKMSGNRITALIVVAILHVVVGYALVTGLAASAFKKVKEVTTAIDIKEEKPKEEPPPPPPKQDTPPPPIVAPPPPISFNAPAPQIETVTTPPPVVLPPAPVAVPAPPPPPAPKVPAKGATPKGNPGNWVTTNDYPSRARREEAQGVTGFRLSIGPDGRVADCTITRSSGNSDLDQATCDNLRRRARFNPAVGSDGAPMTGSYSSSVRWQLED